MNNHNQNARLAIILLCLVSMSWINCSSQLSTARACREENDRLSQSVTELNNEIKDLNERFEGYISSTKSKFDTIEKHIVENENEISALKGELDRLSKAQGSEQTNSVSIKKSNFEIGEECSVPSVSTHVKYCTDYRFYNLWYTPHYRLQQVAWTDELGMRRYNNDYLVALGSYYSTDIGDRFEVTLDTGKTFTVMLADGKWDSDCDESNMYTPCVDYNGEYAGNLLEFIMDKYSVSNEMYAYGSLDYYEEFKGSVSKMVYLGRDASEDWDTYL